MKYDDSALRDDLIRVAYENPKARKDLLPFIKEASGGGIDPEKAETAASLSEETLNGLHLKLTELSIQLQSAHKASETAMDYVKFSPDPVKVNQALEGLGSIWEQLLKTFEECQEDMNRIREWLKDVK